MMNKKGFFVVDAVFAVWIITMLIVIIAVVSTFVFRVQQSNQIYLESTEIILAHMNELSVRADWVTLNGQVRRFNNNLYCIYEVATTVYHTLQLRTRFFISEREYPFLLERMMAP